MQDAPAPEDFLRDEDIQETIYRSTLMPGWFKFCLGMLIIVYSILFIGLIVTISTLTGKFVGVMDSDYILILVIYWTFLVFSLLTVVVATMFFVQSGYAVMLGIPVFIMMLLMGLLMLMGYLSTQQQSYWTLLFVIFNLCAFSAVTVQVFRIRKNWKRAIIVH